MNKYQTLKARAIEKAQDFQRAISNGDFLTWSDCAYYSDYFSKLAKRYGLIKEFKENGII